MSITDKVSGLDELWFIGDNFVAATYRQHFKKTKIKSFVKENFEVFAFCSSKFADKNTNMISRMQIAFATALNKRIYLPKFVVIVLDDDLIQYLQYKNYGVSTMYGTWIEYLAKEFNSMVQDRIAQLPTKARRNPRFEPHIYWMALPAHNGFDETETLMRTKFNLCMESVVRTYANMRVIKPKVIWDKTDSNLVVNNRMTETGQEMYWRTIDSVLQFNMQKRDEFLIREDAKSANKQPSAKKNDNSLMTNEDPVRRFFKRKRNKQCPREAFTEDSRRSPNQGNKFMLPRIKPKY